MTSAALVPAHELKTALAENLALFGVDIAALQTPTAQYVVATMGIAMLAWALWACVWPERKTNRFDDVRGWSVSVHPGMPAVAARNGNLDRFLLQMCQFANLSKDQARIIELEVLVPFYDRSKEPVRLVKTRTEQLPYEDVWKDSNPRYSANLLFPITIAPNSIVEGRVEMEVPGGVNVSDIDWSDPLIRVRETRGARSITIRPNHVYDAAKDKQYRGLIGSPFPRAVQHTLRKLKEVTAHISRGD